MAGCKNIYLGETRIATRLNMEKNPSTGYEAVNTYYYHRGCMCEQQTKSATSTDHLGSSNIVTTPDGEVFEHIEYTPYGETWIEKSDDDLDMLPYRFTAKELDEETGLYYYGARYLNPRTSRWISSDPSFQSYVLQPGQKINELPGRGGVYNHINLNLYHYAGNNPTKYTDPTGRYLIIDDFIFSAIGNLTGARDDGLWDGTFSNFTNRWKTIGGTLWGMARNPWAAPVTLAGGFASYIGVELFGGKVTIEDGYTYTSVDKKFGAFSLGYNISYGNANGDSKSVDKVLTHERGHTEQANMLGAFYFLVIALPSLFSAAMDEMGVWDHEKFWTETWANELGEVEDE